MKIAIANDHGGTEAKFILLKHLEKLGHQVEDFGTDSIESCDYPDYGIPASLSVAKKENERAILICSNGIGMSILSNKIPGIIGALVYSKTSAVNTRKHHDSNILCLGGKEFSPEILLEFVDLWLTTNFEGGRHLRRMEKIKKLEQNIVESSIK